MCLSGVPPNFLSMPRIQTILKNTNRAPVLRTTPGPKPVVYDMSFIAHCERWINKQTFSFFNIKDFIAMCSVLWKNTNKFHYWDVFICFQLRELQQQMEEEQRAKEEARDQYQAAERRGMMMSTELDELRSSLEAAERARKNAENELSETNDRVNELSTQNASLAAHKRRLEGDVQAMQVSVTITAFLLKLNTTTQRNAIKKCYLYFVCLVSLL